MSLKITLKDSDNEIERKINQAIAEEMNSRIRKRSSKAEQRIRQLLPGWLNSQPEVQSLQDEGTPNSLNAQLGLTRGQGALAVNDLIAAISSAIKVQVKQLNPRNLQGGVEFSIQPESLRNLLGLPSGFVVSESGPLHWLSWLLIEGTSTIVYGYSYVPDFSGRSGGGSMTKGGAWRIPPQFAGTLGDNFVTRALANHDKELTAILQDILND